MSIVAIEGADAAGKATQAKILAERLNASQFAFPSYETTAGQAILGNLTDKWKAVRYQKRRNALDERGGSHEDFATDDKLNAIALQSLMLTNRMERGAEMRAAASKGNIVLDRYDASAMVYGSLDGLDPAWLEMTNAQLPVRPNLYILLDITVDYSFSRRPDRRDRYEKDRVFMEKVRIAYLKLFAEQQEKRLRWLQDGGQSNLPHARWCIVDGTAPIEEVSAKIWDICVESGMC